MKMFFVALLKEVPESRRKDKAIPEFYNPCGTDYGSYHRLKTIKGVENRLRNFPKCPRGITHVAIFSLTEATKFKSELWDCRRIYEVKDGEIDMSVALYYYPVNFII